MPSSKRFHSRKRRLIDKRQQIRFAIEIGLYASLLPTIFLLLAAGSHFAMWLIGADAEIMHPLLHQYFVFIVSHWWGVLLALGVLGYVSLWFSHKIFGPMYRFESALLQKQENPTDPVSCKLRKGDYFHDFAGRFEEFLNQG